MAMDISEMIAYASIDELRAMVTEATTELLNRSYVCRHCGRDIPQAFATHHPRHDPTCQRHGSIVWPRMDWFAEVENGWKAVQ